MSPQPRTTDPIVPIPPATKLTYEQSNALMSDAGFRGRIKVACLTFAAYIMGEPADTPAHSSRLKWATNTFINPEFAAQQVQPPVTMDDAVQTGGSEITDAALQSAVEITVGKIL